jgi:hypothetical protein
MYIHIFMYGILSTVIERGLCSVNGAELKKKSQISNNIIKYRSTQLPYMGNLYIKCKMFIIKL